MPRSNLGMRVVALLPKRLKPCEGVGQPTKNRSCGSKLALKVIYYVRLRAKLNFFKVDGRYLT